MTTTSALLRPLVTACEPAALHLLMCPFAGASRGAFRDWHPLDDLGLDVTLVTYPGRDHRMGEPCAEHIDQLADQLADAIRTLPDPRPLLLAGHSMGAQVAFETCARLEQNGTPPAGLVLSGCHAPHLGGRRQLSHLGDQAFVEQLVEMGGCGAELLSTPALRALFLPLLRADFRATERYRHAPAPPSPAVHTPSLLLHGSHDREASRDEVQAWQAWLRHAGPPVTVAGDHFHVTRRPRAFLGQVMHHFESLTFYPDR